MTSTITTSDAGPTAPENPPPIARPTPTRRVDGWAWAGLPAVAIMALVFVAPMIFTVVQSLVDPSPANYVDAVTSTLFQRSVGTTLSMAVVVTGGSLLVAYPFAYVMARSGGVLAMVLGACVLVSFWTSFLVRTFSWQVMLAPTGIVNELLLSSGVISEPLEMLRTEFAVNVAMIHILSPLAILVIYTRLRTIPRELELAALSMGARPFVAFWRVTFPLTVPAAFAGAVLVFVTGLGYYIVAQLLGDSSRLYVGEVVVMQIQRFLEPGIGAAMSILVLVVVVGVLALAARVSGVAEVLGLAAPKRRKQP